MDISNLNKVTDRSKVACYVLLNVFRIAQTVFVFNGLFCHGVVNIDYVWFVCDIFSMSSKYIFMKLVSFKHAFGCDKVHFIFWGKRYNQFIFKRIDASGLSHIL